MIFLWVIELKWALKYDTKHKDALYLKSDPIEVTGRGHISKTSFLAGVAQNIFIYELIGLKY